MAHFAKINQNNIVEQIIVIDNSYEHIGQEYINNELGLDGEWIQTSYNNNFRKQYAGIGYTYDRVKDIFVTFKPFDSWKLNENSDWEAPIPKPTNESKWLWDDVEQIWKDKYSI
jgi:hypothetical protein